jgi:hypothetical protein
VTEMTRGQAACIAWNEQFGEQFGIIAADEWDLGDPRGHAAWEAAADVVAKPIEAERDKAYRERAHLVAYLTAVYPSVMLTDSADPDWPIVFVSTPSGQMSWHIAATDTDLFQHVPSTTCATWDGHTTEQKYERLAELTRTVATGIYGPQPGADL